MKQGSYCAPTEVSPIQKYAAAANGDTCWLGGTSTCLGTQYGDWGNKTGRTGVGRNHVLLL